MRLTLPWPPSVNGYWRAVKGRQILSERGREFRNRAMAAVLEQAEKPLRPLEGALAVVIDLYPPSSRKYDVDNYGKAVLDALEHSGVFYGDHQIARLELVKHGKDGRGRAEVKITLIERG